MYFEQLLGTAVHGPTFSGYAEAGGSNYARVNFLLAWPNYYNLLHHP
jgi:hypothetical protein